MDVPSPRPHAALVEKLAESLTGPVPGGTTRHVSGMVRFPGKVTAVVGARRAGKTTFLHQLRRERLEAGFPRERLPYVDFEDERLVGLSADQLHVLVDDYYRRFPDLRGRETVMWCFDEIQNVPGWERFARRLIETERAEVFVTGSSAALLSREIATALRGRAWTVVLHPFSFAEALAHAGIPVPADPEMVTAGTRSTLERALQDYLTVGGFPEAQGLDAAARFQLLRDYVDVAMLRDVVERHGVSNVAGLRWLVRHLLANAAGMFSVERFYAALRSQGIAISKDTVHQLLEHLQDCFLVRTIWMEAASERQRMVNPRKAYPVDTGFIPVFDRSGRANAGHALETAVLVELERRRLDVTYVRTPGGFEIDVLARAPGGGEELIQVCADPTDTATTDRELRALADAAALYPKARRTLVTLTGAASIPALPAGIVVQPAHVWLLAQAEGRSHR